MAKKEYDKIITRMMVILSKLSDKEPVTVKALAKEFNVSERTIQIDVYERLATFPIFKNEQGYLAFMDGFTLNKSLLNSEEMMLVALALDQFEHVKDFDKTTKKCLTSCFTPILLTPILLNKKISKTLVLTLKS